MKAANSTPEPSPFVQLICYLLAIAIVGYGIYWIFKQLNKFDFWVNYIRTPFFVFMGIGFLMLFFLYGMAGWAMYQNAQEMKKKYPSQQEEEE